MRISDWSSDVCSSDLEFTRTTARAIEAVGGAAQGKAIIILNPAEPPMIMRDTVFTLSEGADEATIRASVEAMVAEVQKYVPGYRLKQEVQFERFGDNNKLNKIGRAHVGTPVTNAHLVCRLLLEKQKK